MSITADKPARNAPVPVLFGTAARTVIILSAASVAWFCCMLSSVTLTPQAFVFGDGAGYLLPVLFGATAENYAKWGGVIMRYPSHLYFWIYTGLPAHDLHFYARALNCAFIAGSALPAFIVARKFLPPSWSVAFALFVIVAPGASYARYVMPECLYVFVFWISLAVYFCLRTRFPLADCPLSPVEMASKLLRPHIRGQPMTFIPARYSHLTFGVIQSGLTSGISAAVASVPFWQERSFLSHWLSAWTVSWLIMLPIVMLAAPVIRACVQRMTRPY